MAKQWIFLKLLLLNFMTSTYFYKYQRSRSFTDLSPRSLRFSSLKISKTTRLFETKLHIEPQWVWEIKVYSWDLGHMTIMTLMPMCGKMDLKFFISGTERLITFEIWY